jgi:hypothetical protein
MILWNGHLVVVAGESSNEPSLSVCKILRILSTQGAVALGVESRGTKAERSKLRQEGKKDTTSISSALLRRPARMSIVFFG